PVLFGPEPTARARRYLDMGLFDVARRQGNLRRSDSAAAACAVALTYSPDDLRWHHRLMLTLLAAGDRQGACRARAEMLRRTGATDDASVGFAIAWSAALIPVEFDSPDFPVSLVERTLELEANADGDVDLPAPSAVIHGAELYRAARYAEAIDKLEFENGWDS